MGELPLNMMDGNELNVKMNVFPNPFNHETNIVIELLGNEEIQLSLHDISGKLVKILDIEKKIAGSYSYSIKEDLVAGIYFVTLTTVQGSTILKMLKN
jgi:hypothetical protein